MGLRARVVTTERDYGINSINNCYSEYFEWLKNFTEVEIEDSDFFIHNKKSLIHSLCSMPISWYDEIAFGDLTNGDVVEKTLSFCDESPFWYLRLEWF